MQLCFVGDRDAVPMEMLANALLPCRLFALGLRHAPSAHRDDPKSAIDNAQRSLMRSLLRVAESPTRPAKLRSRCL